LTEDHQHFLLDDELDEQKTGVKSTTHIWNVADLNAPSRTGVYTGTSTAIDHNLYIRGNRAYQSNYRSGLRILDISNIATSSLSELAFFDIYPVDDAPQFNGAWSNYPFFQSGIVIVGGIEQGLFVLQPTTPLPLLLMLDESGPDPSRAVAIDSQLFLRDPFPVINPDNMLNQGPDKNTRVTVFVKNLQVAQSKASSIVVSLNGQSLVAEQARTVPYNNMEQVTFRLPDGLASGVYTIKVKTPGRESNSGTITIIN
jgi:hypothetical protein